jgi:signal transduction histidine kinase
MQDMDSVHTYGLPNELSQAILNILNNAKDAIVSTKPEKRVVLLNVIKKQIDDKDCIKINIQDSAGGIPKDVMPKIFDPYFTTKHQSQGTGIGLYMTRDIIVKHLDGDKKVSNDDFEIENTKLRGANFCITIPIVQTPKSPS